MSRFNEPPNEPDTGSVALWTRCVFDGPPPEGYTDWHQWVNSKLKTDATIRASTSLDWTACAAAIRAIK
jgi:hypothetical protein